MRLIVGVSGASGAVMGRTLLQVLQATPAVETHLVMTPGARETLRHETGLSPDALRILADAAYRHDDLGAPIASGTFPADGMIVIPCSMKTVAGIASGYSDNLLLRAADVCLKEGRKVVLVPRETPLSRVHLRNLAEAAACGCAIVPPMLSFYAHADTLEAQVRHVVGKVLALFGLPCAGFAPWRGEAGDADAP